MSIPLAPEESSDEAPSADTRSEAERELVVDNDHDNQQDFERLQNMVSELPSTFDDSFRRSSNRIQEDSDRRHGLDGERPITSRIAQRFLAASTCRT